MRWHMGTYPGWCSILWELNKCRSYLNFKRLCKIYLITTQRIHVFWVFIVYCSWHTHADYIMWNARLDESQAEIKIAKRNINNLRYADDTTLMAENKEELKRLLGLPGGASGNGHACQCRRGMRNRFDPWVGKIPWKRACDALQYSCLENPMDRGACWQQSIWS